MSELQFLHADWPAPARVRAAVSLRPGGYSRGVYRGLNLADHVGDEPAAVRQNRDGLVAQLDLPAEPLWLQQVHGTDVVCIDGEVEAAPIADASWATQAGKVCAVLTADARCERALLIIL